MRKGSAHGVLNFRLLHGIERERRLSRKRDFQRVDRLVEAHFDIHEQHAVRLLLLFDCRNRRLPNALDRCRVGQHGKLVAFPTLSCLNGLHLRGRH